MFERYTEKARRVIFFARYESSQLGGSMIEPEHLLLGLLREDKPLADRFLGSTAAIESIRAQIEERGERSQGNAIAVSVDLPLSSEGKLVLAYGAEESERMGHREIHTSHLFLGILRQEGTFAAGLLRERGLDLASVREDAARSKPGSSAQPTCPAPDSTHALRGILLAREASGGITVAVRPTVGHAHAPDFAIYAGRGVITDGVPLVDEPAAPPSPPEEEIAHLRRQIRELTQHLETAIGNHDFTQARAYSDEEREARGLLRRRLAGQGASGPPNRPAPILCIEIARDDESFSNLQRRCDRCLSTGVAQVWLLAFSTQRAYTVTASEGLRECKGETLRITDPVELELDLLKVFLAPP